MITLEDIPLPASTDLAPKGHYPLSLHMSRGEILWVQGPAQSGKTALLEQLALLRRPTSGRMSIMNYDAGPAISARTRKLLRQRISLIEAMPVFMERLTLADNIALPLELAHFRNGDINREVDAIIRWFGLADVAEARPDTLSHTTRLRAACARALITQPSVILIDEPALTLCPTLREQLLSTIRGLVQNGATALLAVQSPPADAVQSDRHLLLPAMPDAPSSGTSFTPPAPPPASSAAPLPDTAMPGMAVPDASFPNVTPPKTPSETFPAAQAPSSFAERTEQPSAPSPITQTAPLPPHAWQAEPTEPGRDASHREEAGQKGVQP